MSSTPESPASQSAPKHTAPTPQQKQYLIVPADFTILPHPRSIQEAASQFDKHFKGWWNLIDDDLKKFDLFIGHWCIFGQVFGDYRFDLYRKVFEEEPDKNPQGFFYKSRHNESWRTEIAKRKKRSAEARAKANS